MKAVIFDVYGTLMSLEDFDDSMSHEGQLLRAFGKLRKKYGIKISAKELLEYMMAAIATIHKRKETRGIKYPEIKIENVWKMIMKKAGKRIDDRTALKMAFDANHYSRKRELYPNATKTLLELKDKGIKLGIISNAQFYTEIDLLKRMKKDAKINSIYDIFEKQLCFFSFKEGYSKPNLRSFIKLKSRLNRKNINMSEALFVGNDMLKDIWAADKARMKTCLFLCPETKLRKNEVKVKPDYRIKNLKEIIKIVK